LNILLIRLRLIGDVVFTTPAIRALREAFPGARLTYLVEPRAAPVVRLNPHLDEVLVIARTRGLRRLFDDVRWARALRARRFDLVLDFHGGPRGAWLTRATAAPQRVGYAITGRRGVYTQLVSRAPDLRPRHSVENQWDLLRALGGVLDRDPDPARDPVEMPVDPAAAAALDRRLRERGLDRHPLIVVHVSAGNPFRRWPEDAFVSLVSGLAAGDADRRIILTAGPSDRSATARIAAQVRRRAGANDAGAVVELDDLDLAQLHALTARAALFVGGDSGPLHVASTTGTPIVGIFGPTLAARSAPWRDPSCFAASIDAGGLPCRPCEQRVCVPGDFRCLTYLPAVTVLEAAERALATRARAVEP
jgi:ADP-heptose:LPS heptosyltransferase